MASVTGIPLTDIRAAIIEQREFKRSADGLRYKRVTTLGAADLIGAMDLLGWSLTENDGSDPTAYDRHLPKLMTLEEFCEQRGVGGPYIVSAGHHWQAIGGGEFCDTFTMSPISIEIALRPGKGRAGKWVKRWYRFSQATNPAPQPSA